ncbi:uncharacterized protein [Triticum aestivum]|uniref:uncharacterized protein n=1 Tax=Triticum aestivum TaxID=4565 RepID=UPI001D02EF3C|nr:uncharacterized protein LOC123045094 [Triticum aestivum]
MEAKVQPYVFLPAARSSLSELRRRTAIRAVTPGSSSGCCRPQSTEIGAQVLLLTGRRTSRGAPGGSTSRPVGEEQQLADEQQKKLEVEEELESQARLELQVQALETQARAGPVRRRRRPWAAGGIAAQPWAAGGDRDAALGGGRDHGWRGWRRSSALQQWSRRPSRWSPWRSRWTARRSSPPCGRHSSPRAAQLGRGGGGSQRWRRPWPSSPARPYGGCRRWRGRPRCASATKKGGRSSGV